MPLLGQPGQRAEAVPAQVAGELAEAARPAEAVGAQRFPHAVGIAELRQCALVVVAVAQVEALAVDQQLVVGRQATVVVAVAAADLAADRADVGGLQFAVGEVAVADVVGAVGVVDRKERPQICRPPMLQI